MDDYSLLNSVNKNVVLSDPIGYLDFLNLLRQAELVITDSGGIQEEKQRKKAEAMQWATSALAVGISQLFKLSEGV